MMKTENTLQLLILGKGEIARQLCTLAISAGYPVDVMEADVSAIAWPPGTNLRSQVYSESPYRLPRHTHAIIVRGHEGDADSVATLLNHDAERVYLIASARRAQSVIESAAPLVEDSSRLSRLSAPAGLDLGGNGSAEIALSILAEIQMRHHGGSAQTLSDLRAERAAQPKSGHGDQLCPGKRA